MNVAEHHRIERTPTGWVIVATYNGLSNSEEFTTKREARAALVAMRKIAREYSKYLATGKMSPEIRRFAIGASDVATQPH